MHKRNLISPNQPGEKPELTQWQAAVTFARLYGIAETLNPWPYLDNERFFRKIEAWTQEYLQSGEEDLLHFFEQKIL